MTKAEFKEFMAYNKMIKMSPTSNKFCVPAALSALTGLHVDEVCDLIREEIGDQPITGIFYPLALKILVKLGYQYQEVKYAYADSTYLVHMHGHCGAILNGVYYDNQQPNGGQPKQKILKTFKVWRSICDR